MTGSANCDIVSKERGDFLRSKVKMFQRAHSLQLAAGMKGKVNRAEAHQSEGGLITLYHVKVGKATAQFHSDSPRLAAWSFSKLDDL